VWESNSPRWAEFEFAIRPTSTLAIALILVRSEWPNKGLSQGHWQVNVARDLRSLPTDATARKIPRQHMEGDMADVTLDNDDGLTSIAVQAEQAVKAYQARFGSRPSQIVLTRAQYVRLSAEMALGMSAPNPAVLMLASLPLKIVANPEIG
jgi:hypothetical protein